MNSILWFRNKKVEKAYYQELTPYLQKIQNIMICAVIFKQVLWAIGSIIFDFETYKQSWVSTTITAGIEVLGTILVTLVKNNLNYLLRTWFCNHPKYITWVLDCIIIVALYYTVAGVLQVQDQVKDQTPLQSFYLGSTWFFQAYYCVFFILNWPARSAFFIVMLVAGPLSDLDISKPEDKVKVMNMCLNCIMAFAIYFSVEKSNRELFLHRESLMQKSEAWKKMVNQLPEGLALISKEGAVLFNNQALRMVVQNEAGIESDSTYNKESLRTEDFSRFENLTIGYCDKSLSSNRFVYDASRTNEAGINTDDEDDRTPIVQRNLQGDFTRFLKNLLDQWNEVLKSPSFSSASADQNPAFPNDQHLILLDSQISHSTQNKSFSIKIWFTLFDEQQVLVLLFSETTQMKLIHTLQDRDAYRSRLLASVSHELRTPLNASNNFLERLHEDKRVPEDLKEEYIVPAMRSNTLLLNIINDILDFSQLQHNKLRLNFKAENICTDIRECIKLFEIQSRLKDVSLSFVNPDERFDGRFITDHNRVKQIVLNLVSNAVKFTRVGYIRVSVFEHRTELNSLKRQLKITVEDTGVGIPEEEQNNLFKEFTQIESSYRSTMNPNGAGLGLMIANSLSLLLGPKVDYKGLKVESKEGVGSTFSLVLEEKQDMDTFVSESSPSHNRMVSIDSGPIGKIILPVKGSLKEKDIELEIFVPQKQESSIRLIPDERIDHSELDSFLKKLQGNKTPIPKNFTPTPTTIQTCSCPEILVVDDDGFNIIAIESILRSFKLKNDRAFNGKEAVLQAENRAQKRCGPSCCYYRIILMDLTMPVMNGFEATIALRTLMREGKIPTTYISACTALAHLLDEEKALAAGMDEYCIKPLSKAKIAALFNKLKIKY